MHTTYWLENLKGKNLDDMGLSDMITLKWIGLFKKQGIKMWTGFNCLKKKKFSVRLL
jgi:hypothetical protein